MGAGRRERLATSNIFVTIKVIPGAALMGSRLGLSRGKCVYTKRRKIADTPKIFTTKSVHAGTLHRVMATISSKTGTITSTRGCL